VHVCGEQQRMQERWATLMHCNKEREKLRSIVGSPGSPLATGSSSWHQWTSQPVVEIGAAGHAEGSRQMRSMTPLQRSPFLREIYSSLLIPPAHLHHTCSRPVLCKIAKPVSHVLVFALSAAAPGLSEQVSSCSTL
jgi:hypothetical protein